jgi:hypothetical protein
MGVVKDRTGSNSRRAFESGIGLPHSKTLTRIPKRHELREVLECGSPMPL